MSIYFWSHTCVSVCLFVCVCEYACLPFCHLLCLLLIISLHFVEFVGGEVRFLRLFVGYLPHLQNVVLCTGGKHQPFVQIPGEVRNFARMTPVDKDQLRRSISLLFFSLSSTAPCQIPDHYPSICARTGQQIADLPAEFDSVDLVFVLPQTKQFRFHVSRVPHGNGSIS